MNNCTRFLALVTAALVLAGGTGCRRSPPTDQAVNTLKAGLPAYFTTADAIAEKLKLRDDFWQIKLKMSVCADQDLYVWHETDPRASFVFGDARLTMPISRYLTEEQRQHLSENVNVPYDLLRQDTDQAKEAQKLNKVLSAPEPRLCVIAKKHAKAEKADVYATLGAERMAGGTWRMEILSTEPALKSWGLPLERFEKDAVVFGGPAFARAIDEYLSTRQQARQQLLSLCDTFNRQKQDLADKERAAKEMQVAEQRQAAEKAQAVEKAKRDEFELKVKAMFQPGAVYQGTFTISSNGHAYAVRLTILPPETVGDPSIRAVMMDPKNANLKKIYIGTLKTAVDSPYQLRLSGEKVIGKPENPYVDKNPEVGFVYSVLETFAFDFKLPDIDVGAITGTFENDKLYNRPGAWQFTRVVFDLHRIVGSQAAGEVAPAAAAADWQAQRQKLQDQVTKELATQPAPSVTPEQVAAQMRLPWPAPEPADTPEAIQAKIAKAVDAEMGKSSALAEKSTAVAAEADKRFAPFVVGTKIVVHLKPGAAAMRLGKTVEGTYYRSNSDQVVVGSNTVKLAEVDEADTVKFDADRCAADKESYLRKRTMALKREQDETRSELLQARLRTEMPKQGYALMNRTWTPIGEIVAGEVKRKTDEMAAQQRREAEKRVFQANGFILKGSEWIPSWAE